jgi:hypothetical protein
MRKIPLQIIEIAMLVAALVVGFPSGSPAPGVTLVNASPALAGHVEWAFELFADHGLAQPVVTTLAFDPHAEICEDYRGYFEAPTAAIVVCFDASTTVLGTDTALHPGEQRLLLHELAHAWTARNLGAERQQQFIDLMGATSWNSLDDRAHRRGIELAAETFVWALTDGEVVPRMIASREAAQLQAGFDVLTSGEGR